MSCVAAIREAGGVYFMLTCSYVVAFVPVSTTSVLYTGVGGGGGQGGRERSNDTPQ